MAMEDESKCLKPEVLKFRRDRRLNSIITRNQYA